MAVQSKATAQNGGINSANEQKYLQNLYKTGTGGQKSWASSRAQQLGINIGTSNPGQASITSVHQPVARITSAGRPTNYSQLWSPQQIAEYAKGVAGNKFENERLGYNQNIERNRLKIDQQLTDKEIADRAKRFANHKYADAILENNLARDRAQTQYDTGKLGIEHAYNTSKEDMQDMFMEQRGTAVGEAGARGAAQSRVGMQKVDIVDQRETKSMEALASDFNNNISMLERELAQTLHEYNSKGVSLTQRQQEEMAARIDELTRERDNQIESLDQLINQDYQNINQARNNIATNENTLYTDLFGRNQQTFDQRNQFNQNMAFDRQKHADNQRLQYAQLGEQRAARGAAAAERAAREAEERNKVRSDFFAQSKTLSQDILDGKITYNEAHNLVRDMYGYGITNQKEYEMIMRELDQANKHVKNVDNTMNGYRNTRDQYTNYLTNPITGVIDGINYLRGGN